MKSSKFLMTACAILGFSVACAQERSLTVDESIALGLEHSKSLHASTMRSQYADAKSSEVSASLYPTLKVQAGYQRLSSIPTFSIYIPPTLVSFPVVLNNYTSRATIQQPLFTGWKLQAAADNAAYSANAAHSDFENDRAALVYDIRAAYWNVYKAKEVRRLADENVLQIKSHLEDIENMLKQGSATMNEVLKVRVQLSNATILQSDAKNNVLIATIAFNSVIGIPLQTEVGIASPLTPTSSVPAKLGDLVDRAMTQRSDVQGMEWRVKAAEAGVTAAQSGWLPQLYLTGDYYYDRPNPRIFPAKDEYKDSWDVGVSLQFDVWDNLTTVHQTSEARSQYEEAKDGLGSLRDEITLDVTQSYLNVQQSSERIQLAKLTVEQAEENLRVTKEKFTAGLTTNSELLDAEEAALQSKIQQTQALVDFELAQAKLEQTIGELHP
ncbi:MAG TPA: TolC family protein [Bacteroidota bacterium]|nr:TolC family protein [Bacteroidota bacterium]